MQKRRILVTGASGLLGLNLALEASQEHQVFGQVKDHPLHTERFTPLQADLLDPGSVRRLLDQSEPDWVIHCAALANVDACENNPTQAFQLNTQVPRQLAEAVARGGARLLHISTDAVFDGRRGDYCEEDAPNPLSVYAKTKLQGELAVAEADPGAIIARVNLFGWSLSGRRSLAEFFFNNLQAGNRCQGFTDVYFCPLLVNDLAQVLLKMLERGLQGLYHVVGSKGITKYEFGLAIARRFGFREDLVTPVSVMDGGLKASRSPRLTLRIDRLRNDLGQEIPAVSDGLERFYQLYRQGYPQYLKQLGDASFR